MERLGVGFRTSETRVSVFPGAVFAASASETANETGARPFAFVAAGAATGLGFGGRTPRIDPSELFGLLVSVTGSGTLPTPVDLLRFDSRFLRFLGMGVSTVVIMVLRCQLWRVFRHFKEWYQASR